MSDLFPIYLQTNVSLFVILAAGILAFLSGFLLYRTTTPPVSIRLRITLGILRGLAAAAIFVLLFAPEITIVWDKSVPRQIVLAVDRSSSMGIEENGVTRVARANKIAGDLEEELSSFSQVLTYSFNTDTIAKTGLSADTTFGGTDLVHSLSTILNRHENADDLVILTDGRVTVGRDPLYAQIGEKNRLNTIGIGDTLESTDLMITDVKANAQVYQGKPAQIQVELMMKGGSNLTSTVSLSMNNKILSSRMVNFGAPGAVVTEVFDVTPQNAGLARYKVEIAATPDEKIVSNNSYTRAIEVKKGKLNVSLIAGTLDYDLKFLKRLLEENQEIEIGISVLPAANRRFYSDPAQISRDADLLIFYNLPDLPQAFSDGLPESLPVMFILNQRIDSEKARLIQKYFPLKKLTMAEKNWESQVVRTHEGKLNPHLSVFPNENLNSEFWDKCPPVTLPYAIPEFGSGTAAWLESRSGHQNSTEKFPVISGFRTQNRKSVLMLGSGFWRWHFSFADNPGFSHGWSDLMANLIRWITSGTTDKTVTLTSGKNNYEMGQTIGLMTQVFDGSFNPLNDALVRTSVTGPAGSFQIENNLISDGLYDSRFIAFKDGEYQIESVAWYNDIQIGKDTLNVVVSPVNREFMISTQNDALLRQLAEKSGGKYFPEQQAMALLDNIDLAEKYQQVTKTMELWYKMSVLLLIILLLSIEWFLRKRSGLI